MSDVLYGMRKTMCKCGHIAVEHYDSHDFCTYVMNGECDCEQFEAAGPEDWLTWSSGTTDDREPVVSD